MLKYKGFLYISYLHTPVLQKESKFQVMKVPYLLCSFYRNLFNAYSINHWISHGSQKLISEKFLDTLNKKNMSVFKCPLITLGLKIFKFGDTVVK